MAKMSKKVKEISHQEISDAMATFLKKGGIIKDPIIHKRICDDYNEWFTKYCKMKVEGILTSPIKGPKGNIEFLIYAKK